MWPWSMFGYAPLLGGRRIVARQKMARAERCDRMTTESTSERVTDEELAEILSRQARPRLRTFVSLADAQRLAAELRRWRAPVDVEAAIEIAVRSGNQPGPRLVSCLIEDAVRPHVERAAVLAREAEGLRAEVRSLYEEIERLTKERAAWTRAVAEMGKDEIPCGHTVADLIGGTETAPDGTRRPEVTKCGACLAVRQDEYAARRRAMQEPRALAAALTAAEDALLIAGGWQPTERGYLNSGSADRYDRMTYRPRATALDIARKRAVAP